MDRLKIGILLAIVGIFHLCPSFGQLGRVRCTQADQLIIIDYSTSVGPNSSKISKAVKTMLDSTDLDTTGIKIGIMTFDCGSRSVSITADKESLYGEVALLKQTRPHRGTKLLPALQQAVTVCNISSYMRSKCCNQSGVPQFIILISDGNILDDHDPDLWQQIKIIKDNGIIICTIGVGKVTRDNENTLRSIATDESYFIKTDYQHLGQYLVDLRLCSY